MKNPASCARFTVLPVCLFALAISGCGRDTYTSGSTGGGTTATTTSLASSASSVLTGVSVTLTATVTPSAATGTVTFYDGTTSLGTGSLSAGSATLTPSFASTGTHTLTAAYNGSSTYGTSTSGSIAIIVTAASSSGSACGYQDTANGALNTAVDVYSSGTNTLSSPTVSASGTDESAICATGAGTTLNLTNPSVTSSSNTSYQNDSSFYGTDSAVLAYGPGKAANAGAVMNVTGGTITTTGTFASAAYAASATMNISGTTIQASGTGGHGLYCSAGAVMNITNVTATTSGQTGSVVATDTGGCTITLNGGTYTTTGAKSAGLYSTGTISATGGTFSAGDAPAMVIDGTNTIVTNGSTISSANGDGRGYYIFSSAGSNANANTGSITVIGGSLSYSCAAAACSSLSTASGQNSPATMFAANNTTADFSLTNVTVTNSVSTLLEAVALTNGTSGQNGGLVTFTASGTALTGNVIVDAISTATLMLSSGSSLSGAINSANTGSVVALSLDGSSTWTVTGTSYLTTLSDTAGIAGTSVSNIVGNGNTVYYKSASNSSLGGLTYSLAGGGYLKPY